MNAAVEQIQKQFMELQGALSDTANQIKVTEANVIALEAERRRQEITVREVNAEHNAESKMFKPVGRTYVLLTHEELQQNIQEAMTKNETETGEMKRKHEVLTKKHSEIQGNLEDIIKTIQPRGS